MARAFGLAVVVTSALLSSSGAQAQYVDWMDFSPPRDSAGYLPAYINYQPFPYPKERTGGAVADLIRALRSHYRTSIFGDTIDAALLNSGAAGSIGPSPFSEARKWWRGLRGRVAPVIVDDREWCLDAAGEQPCLTETDGLLCRFDYEGRLGEPCTLLGDLVESLERRFEAAVAERPEIHWVRAQYVYWLVKQGKLAKATETAAGCPGEDWECFAIRAHARYHMHDVVGAEDFWDRALARMPEEDWCYWTDIRELFEVDFRGNFYSTGCDERAELTKKIWWLGDPMWLLEGNDRRVEHFDRVFRASMIAGIGRTGSQVLPDFIRHDWVKEGHFDGWIARDDLPLTRRGSGGTGIRAIGSAVAGGADYLPPLPEHRPPNGRWYEPISSARYHFLPSEEILDAPLHVEPEDWNLVVEPEEGWPAPYWGSVERYQPYFAPIYSLDKQSAAFLRDDAMAVVIATSTAHLPGFNGARSLPGVAWMRSADDEMHTVPLRERGFATGSWVARLLTEPTDALFSVEVITSEHGAARVRFGEGPPENPADAHLKASDILLFDPSDGLPADLGQAAPKALTSHTVPQGSVVGAFWELYGQRPDETIVYSLRVVPTDASTMERLGRAIRLADPEPVITTTFEAPAPDEPGPVEPRSLEIDLSELVPGSYRLEIDAWSAIEARILRLSTPIVIAAPDGASG